MRRLLIAGLPLTALVITLILLQKPNAHAEPAADAVDLTGLSLTDEQMTVSVAQPQNFYMDQGILYHRTDTGLLQLVEGRAILMAFVPAIDESLDYLDVMSGALNTYFALGKGLMGFNEEDFMYTPDKLEVLLVAPESPEVLEAYAQEHGLTYHLVSDPEQKLAEVIGWDVYAGNTEDARILFFDRWAQLVYNDQQFRGEGERLKELLSTVRTHFELEESPEHNVYMPLVSGEKARDFNYAYIDAEVLSNSENKTKHQLYWLSQDSLPTASLSDLQGKNVLLAFYPAPFSFACALEVDYFDDYMQDRLATDLGDDLEILMVSSTNPAVTADWYREKGAQHVKLVVDGSGEISAKYSSMSDIGPYNKRTVYLIDKEGTIQYIDMDYQVNDEDFSLLREAIAKL